MLWIEKKVCVLHRFLESFGASFDAGLTKVRIRKRFQKFLDAATLDKDQERRIKIKERELDYLDKDS